MGGRKYLPLLLAGSLLLACGGSGSTGSPLLRVPVEGSPQRGPSDAWVTVVEFADFECPYCRAEEPVVADLEAAYGTDLRLVFKYFPLTSIHPDAEAAAVAAGCAGEQGKFWEMHDLLFTTALDGNTLLADAEQVSGLEVATWQTCIGSAEAAAMVNSDLALGLGLGIHGTPTFVINGVPVVGAVPEERLRGVIDQVKAKAIASGIPPADYYNKAVLGL
jgi:protein-disulfide isomerase